MPALDAAMLGKDQAASGGSSPAIPSMIQQLQANQPSARADHVRAAQVPMPAGLLGTALADLPFTIASVRDCSCCLCMTCHNQSSKNTKSSNNLCDSHCGILSLSGNLNFSS